MIRTLAWVLLLTAPAASLFSADLEVSTRWDTLVWASGRADTTAGHTFTGTDLFWNVQGSLTQTLGDALLFRGGLEIDPVLRWRAYSRLGFTLDNLTLNFAPFLGLFNSTQKWFNPGMEAQVEYTWPGLVFARGGFLTTFAPVSKTGDYYLSAQSAAVGFLLENGIVTFSIEDKSATFQVKDALATVDSSTKYWLETEMFLKNFPLRWALLTGYQITNRTYVATSDTSTPLHSALLGARLVWDFGSQLSVYTQGETSLFNAGWNATVLKLPASRSLVQVVSGLRYHW